MNGLALRSQGTKGELITDDSFYIIFNAYHEPLSYKIPFEKLGGNWVKVIDTSINFICEEAISDQFSDIVAVDGRSVVVLKQPKA